MNPIIQAITDHIQKGDRPVNFWSDLEPAHDPGGILVKLADGREVQHKLNHTDHLEYAKWFRDAGQWWSTLPISRKGMR